MISRRSMFGLALVPVAPVQAATNANAMTLRLPSYVVDKPWFRPSVMARFYFQCALAADTPKDRVDCLRGADWCQELAGKQARGD